MLKVFSPRVFQYPSSPFLVKLVMETNMEKVKIIQDWDLVKRLLQEMEDGKTIPEIQEKTDE